MTEPILRSPVNRYLLRMTEVLSILDHLVYATPDVEATLERLESLLGVRPIIGGQHPHWGTKNALLSLGPGAYLEIMGPDPSQAEPTQPRPFGMDAMLTPRLVAWVARADDIELVLDKARRKGIDLGGAQDRSRRKPDGSLLTWRMTDPTKNRMDGIIPYFISWGDTPHPAESSPKGCRLMKLEAFHPEARRARELLKGLEIDLPVSRGPVSLKAKIETPKGHVVLE